MLTSLVLYGVSIDAVEVLSMLQQAWPGITPSSAKGTLTDPWAPSEPAQWFWCAKELAKKNRAAVTGKVWIKAGGRMLGISINNFYVSDYGMPVAPVRAAGPAPKRAPVPVAPVEPAAVYDDPTYPAIYGLLAPSPPATVRDADVAAAIRNILRGVEFAGAPILPCLTVVLFIAEVARNHTAFHTNLMLLDLVEKAVKLSDDGAPAVRYRWENVIWQTGQIDANVELILAGLKIRFDRLLKSKEFKRERRGVSPLDETAQFGASFEGGEQSLSGGISAMAHTGSVRGSAFDLTGVGVHRFVKGGTTDEVPTFVHKSKVVQWTAEINSEIAFCDAQERRIQALRPVPADKQKQIKAVLDSKTELLKTKAAMLVLSTALAANEKFKGLTLVRRKEATITIRWLSERLDAGGFKAKSAVQGTATAYSFVEGMAKSESAGAESGAKEIVASKTMLEIQKRVNTFDLLLA